MNLLKKILFVKATMLLVLAGVAQANTDDAIIERIKPVGEVCIKGQDCDTSKVVPVPATDTEEAGDSASETAVGGDAGTDAAADE